MKNKNFFMPYTLIKFLEPFEKEFMKKMPKKRGLVITVSGSASSGKTTGAKIIAEKFKLKYISAGEIFRDIAAERGIPIEKFASMGEPEIDHEMDKRSLMYAIKGGCVLDGRMTGWAAGKWADVKIYYDCDLTIKAKRIAKNSGITVEEAKKIIGERDEEDNKRYMGLYGINLFDKSIYDIIINNDELTMKEAMVVPVELVKKSLQKR
jgi:cytidylate kinase